MQTSDTCRPDPLQHPLLTAVGCPASGDGALTYLQQLLRTLDACRAMDIGNSAKEWQERIKTLIKAVIDSAPSASPSPKPSDLMQHPWGNIHACIDARGKVRHQSTRHLDALLGLMLLETATGGKALTAEALSGLKTCYRTLSGSRKLHVEWELISSPLIVDEIKLKELLTGLSHPPVRAFGQLVLGYLMKPMPTPDGVETVMATPTVLDCGIDAIASALTVSPSVDSTADLEQTPADGAEEHDVDTAASSRFERGDSVIAWHHNQAHFSSRNNRLGLESWQTLSGDQVCLITAKLPAILMDPASPMHCAAILVTASLLTSTPGHVLMHAKLNACNDLWIDTRGRRFCWSMEALRESGGAFTANPQRWVSISFPQVFSEAIHGLTPASDEPSYFGDLLVQSGPAAWHGLLRQTHELLMKLGDSAFPAFPGRWANSIARVYLETCQSDLMASVCTLSLVPTLSTALYYFHPSEHDIIQTVSTVYHRLGLGKATEQQPACTNRAIPSNEKLKNGFLQLEDRATQLNRTIHNTRSDLSTCANACNELTQLTAAMCVFSVGGRGSRVEEITNGALWCDAGVLCLEDKKVEHEGGTRILPKPSRLQHWLRRLFMARQRLAEQVAPTLRRDLAGRWKELASGQLRFDTPAFEWLELQPGKVKRSPLTAAHVEEVAQRYFQASKNFMRHVLITHWALDSDDRHLLRLVTGHARSGLAMPSAGAMYTPKSAVLAAGKILDKQLSKWLPEVGSGAPQSLRYQFVALPGRRILKVHGAYREHMQTWDCGVWSRWHLAAARIMNRLRHALLNGQGPKALMAQLWLHLVCFDGLNEQLDLDAVISQIRASAVLGAAGWLIRLRRPGSSHMLVIAVQAPTALLLQRIVAAQEEHTAAFAEIADQAGQWVATTTPDCWGGAKDGIAEALLACSRLWTDWVLPPAVQLCYHADSHAPLLDDKSNSALYGLPWHGSNDPIAPPPRSSHPQDLLSTFFKAINRLGSSRLQLGEQKKRAQLFERWLKLDRIPRAGSLAGTLIQVVGVNVLRIKAGKKGAIEWSSQATYFSTLRPFLQGHANQSADDFDALDWLDFCQELHEFAHKADKETVPAREAASWLMRCLHELGYPLPPQEALLHFARQPVATTTAAIADIRQSQIDAVRILLSKRPGTPLEKSRLDLAVTLLSSQPLRQAELAALHANDLTLDGQLCITTHGFAHLKSHASRRRLQLQPEVRDGMQAVLSQTLQAQDYGSKDSTIFGCQVQKDGVTNLDSGWLVQALTWAIQVETGNPKFRIHALRARVVSNLLCPDWQDNITTPQPERSGPQCATELFSYQLSRAWKTDVVRMIAGHSSIRTTLSYYFHAWLPVRARALMATLADTKPTDHLLGQIGVTQAALVKACARNLSFQKDPWTYLLGKLPTAAPMPVEPDTDGSQTSAHSNTDPVPLQDTGSGNSSNTHRIERMSSPVALVRYLGMRLLGLDRIATSNALSLDQHAILDELELRLAQSTVDQGALRGRIRGDITGRALRADLKLLLAPTTTPLIDSLSRLPVDHLEALLQLLLPKRNLLTWDTDLCRVAPWLDESSICVEVVADIKAVEPELNLRLARLRSVLIGSPAHEVGTLPRLFIQPRNSEDRSTVAKARWTTLVRVLCCSLLILRTTVEHT